MKKLPLVSRCLAMLLSPLAATLLFITCNVVLAAAPLVSSSRNDAPLAAALPADPIFDLDAIMNDPTDATVLDTEEKDGVVFQTIEYTTRVVGGAPERIKGIFAYTKGAQARPGVFWSNGGMAAASRFFPELMARNGYACLAITLPHNLRNSYRIPFDAKNPATANLTLLARDQLRGITVLSQRAEVDPKRMGVAGASYGGVFATLIAGVDPRIKAGFSFFGGGNHALGTNLPQFQKMETLEEVEVWNRTFDPAFRLKQRNIPFMWGVPFNDQWFHFPAVTRTFMEAAGTDKRIAIIPHWQHGFPPEVDQTLFHFLDTTAISAHPRPPYNAPGTPRVRQENGKAIASFSWTGQNPVAKAELVVSYGEYTPWLGWPHRAAFVFPATVAGQSASAALPIPSRRLPVIVWGTITDKDQSIVSTPPLIMSTEDLAALPVTPDLQLNCFIDGDLGDEGLTFYRNSGEPLPGQLEKDASCSGGQALRIEPPPPGKPPGKNFSIALFHNVPGLAHRFIARVKAGQPTDITIRLTPVSPASWSSAAVRELVAKDSRLSPLLPRWEKQPAPIAVSAPIGTTWQDVTLDVPIPSGPVDGYKLEIGVAADSHATYWIDTVRMQPVWPE
jgi:dienelactone hydrolase